MIYNKQYFSRLRKLYFYKKCWYDVHVHQVTG